jgi:hypothetical protein
VFYLLGVQRDLLFVGTITNGLSQMKVMWWSFDYLWFVKLQSPKTPIKIRKRDLESGPYTNWIVNHCTLSWSKFEQTLVYTKHRPFAFDFKAWTPSQRKNNTKNPTHFSH